jgi:hypothetical protein
LELTRTINTAKLPLCADFEARKQLGPWLDVNDVQAKPNTCFDCWTISVMLQQREADRVKVVDTDMKQLALQTRSDIPANQKKMNKGKSNSKHADPCNARHIAEPNPPKYTESQSQVPPGTTQDHLDPHDKRHIWQKFVESGPFSWMWDGFKSFNWDLFTHPCFLTYGHQDAAGFATTVAARTGCKIWCILRPKMDGINTRSKLFDILRVILRQHPFLDYQKVSDAYTLFLMEGDVL